jgi:hypothetical protein
MHIAVMGGGYTSRHTHLSEQTASSNLLANPAILSSKRDAHPRFYAARDRECNRRLGLERTSRQ